MNPFDNLNFATKAIAGIFTPLLGIVTSETPILNPTIQLIALILSIIVSVLSAISIIRQNLK